MSIGKGLVALGLALLIAGCVTTPPIKATFNPAEAAFIHKQGQGKIIGQAFLRRNDGVVVYAAVSEVNLVPKTTYSAERMHALFGDGKFNYFNNAGKMPDGYEDMMRKTKADGEGRFEFDGVADGDYYITTLVVWFAGSRQGGGLMEPITVSGGKAVNVIMTGE